MARNGEKRRERREKIASYLPWKARTRREEARNGEKRRDEARRGEKKREEARRGENSGQEARTRKYSTTANTA